MRALARVMDAVEATCWLASMLLRGRAPVPLDWAPRAGPLVRGAPRPHRRLGRWGR